MRFLSGSGSAAGDGTVPSFRFLCRTILIIIVIGLIIRVVIGFFMTHIYDMYHWGVVIQNINSGNGLYELTGYFYTPPWGYLLGTVAAFQDLVGVTVIGETLTEFLSVEGVAWHYTATVTTPAFNISLKLMLILSDLVVGYLVFWIIRDITADRKKAVIGFALWFLCPFVIASGSVIGMFDTIAVLMTLLAVIMLRKDRYLEAGVMLCLATLTKFFPGFLIFIFVAYIISKNRWDGSVTKKLSLFLGAVAVTALVTFIPQLLDGTIADTFLFITSRLNEGVGVDGVGAIGGYAAVGIYVLALTVSIIFAMRIIRADEKHKTDGLLFDAILITVTVMFLYPPLPQYLVLLLPFVLIAMTSDRRYRIPCGLLFIGTGIASLAGGPTNLVGIAAFTDLMDTNSLVGIVGGYTDPLLGSNPLLLIGYIGYVIQYIGILAVLWVRFGDDVKKRVFEIRQKRTGEESSDDHADMGDGESVPSDY